MRRADEALDAATHLTPELLDKAVQSLSNSTYYTRTPGVGPGALSSGISH
jgi:hypothetical protein